MVTEGSDRITPITAKSAEISLSTCKPYGQLAGPCSSSVLRPVRSLELKRRSGACPRRRPLLQERAHALLGVGGHGVQRHDGLREVVGLALIDVDLPVERFLADLCGQ